MHLILADGDAGQKGSLTHYTPVPLRIGDHYENLAFDIAVIGYDIMLGHSWIMKHDPSTVVSKRHMQFDSPYCTGRCVQPGDSIIAPIVRARLQSHLTPKYVPVDSRKTPEPCYHFTPSGLG
jgi:hypothetical protein